MISVPISMQVLASLSPQAGLLNMKRGDLIDKKFIFVGLIEDDEYGNDLTSVHNDNGRVKLRFQEAVSKKIVTVPIRGFLYSKVSGDGKDTYNKETSTVTPLHTKLIEDLQGSDQVLLPENFEIVDVEDSMYPNTEIKRYPPHTYKLFQDKLEGLRSDENILTIYRDRAFMSTLKGTDAHVNFPDRECIKDIIFH